MRRVSLYVSEQAADALDAAVGEVVDALGGDLPKHVALSALVIAGAQSAGAVTAQLAAARAEALAAQLEQLRQAAPER